MRKPRFTFKGAFHHVMNRGHNKAEIFPHNSDKVFFISLIKYYSKLLKIRLIAFCVMNNHYHIILQNTSERLSEYMRQVNSIYAIYYRKKYGGCGYVFQDRFKSTLIQNEEYLITSIIYTFLNPVRKNIVETPEEYKYSSIKEYFNEEICDSSTDVEFVENIFGSAINFKKKLYETVKLNIKSTPIGKVLSDEEYYKKVIKKYNRRKDIIENSVRRRRNEYEFRDYKNVIEKFEVEIIRRESKRKILKMMLLIKLREECGMKYSEINRLKIFNIYKLSSLSVLYHRYKRLKM